MNRIRVTSLTVLLLVMLALAACGPAARSSQGAQPATAVGQAATAVPSATLGAPLAPQSTALAPTMPTGQPTSATSGATSTQSAATAAPVTASQSGAAGVGDLQAALQQIYSSANPSVVNIQVTEGQPISTTRRPRIPAVPGLPGMTATPEAPGTPSIPNPHVPGGPLPLPSVAVGSGFVWDNLGRIVTNNHVVDGATTISVTFSDGATVPATVVGTDPDSDLAVIKVDPKGLTLLPIPVGDSTLVHPGQFVVAIGNPFALEGTMTFGIVSAMGRSLPAQVQGQLPGQATFTIPDIIQTDAPINPGNSGGVLLDLQGRLVGVPTAIESASQSNSGIGFAIPSSIVRNIVPELIQNGKAQHPYLGISGTTLGPDLAQAMGLPATQRGALVIDVPQGGPAAGGGLRGSTRQATVNGQQVPIGGDVIVKIDNQPVTRFDDLPSYLARSTKVGQTVVLTVLRDGKQMTLNVTLGNRPSLSSLSGQAAATPGAAAQATPEATTSPTSQAGAAQGTPEATTSPTTQAPAAGATPEPTSPTSAPQLGGIATPAATSAATPAAPAAQMTPPATGGATAQPGAGNVWLGVTVIDLTNEMAQAMNLPGDQQGVLIESVAPNSPAERAGLRGSTRPFSTSQGQQITVGGDVIVGVNGSDVASGQDLTQIIRSAQPGQKVTLTILRNGSQLDVSATLETRPSQ